jgi:hypothetical protein
MKISLLAGVAVVAATLVIAAQLPQLATRNEATVRAALAQRFPELQIDSLSASTWSFSSRTAMASTRCRHWCSPMAGA